MTGRELWKSLQRFIEARNSRYLQNYDVLSKEVTAGIDDFAAFAAVPYKTLPPKPLSEVVNTFRWQLRGDDSTEAQAERLRQELNAAYEARTKAWEGHSETKAHAANDCSATS